MHGCMIITTMRPSFVMVDLKLFLFVFPSLNCSCGTSMVSKFCLNKQWWHLNIYHAMHLISKGENTHGQSSVHLLKLSLAPCSLPASSLLLTSEKLIWRKIRATSMPWQPMNTGTLQQWTPLLFSPLALLFAWQCKLEEIAVINHTHTKATQLFSGSEFTLKVLL